MYFEINALAGKTKLTLVYGDITEQDTEAVVNAANSSLMGGGGVDGAIHRAGGLQILEECIKITKKIGRLEAGKAALTSGGNLKARYVIHTVGPVWKGGKEEEDRVLSEAYTSCLELAEEKGIRSISFPSISTGAYRFPVKKAAETALASVVKFVKNSKSFDEIRFVLFSASDLQYYLSALSRISA